jgi:mannose-1-phosphate guanylyltransferase
MRAFVMAAGLGTRLRPLTDTCPKPLVPLRGRPMVEYPLDHLAAGGVREAIINIHYLPEKMRAFAEAWNAAGRQPHLSIQDETAKILGSGGGLKLGAPWLFAKGGTALVCNADVIASPDLAALAETHRRLGTLSTLVVTPHPEAGRKYTGLRVRDEKIISFEKGGRPDPALMHFPGFYLVEKNAVDRMRAPTEEYSVVDELWKPLAAEGKLGASLYHGEYLDLGTVEDLRLAEDFLRSKKI